LERLKSLIVEHKGDVPLRLSVDDKVFLLDKEFWVDGSPNFVGAVRELFGVQSFA